MPEKLGADGTTVMVGDPAAETVVHMYEDPRCPYCRDFEVKGLRGPSFDAAVRSMKYRSFVTASQKAYERAGGAEEPEGHGTPTAFVKDRRTPVEYSGVLCDGELFGQLLREVGAEPGGWAHAPI